MANGSYISYSTRTSSAIYKNILKWGMNGQSSKSFDCPGIIRRDVKRTIYLVFCSGYTAPIFFSKSTKEVSNVQGAWHTPNTLPNMVHGHAFLIIWQPAPREYTYPPPGNALCIGHFEHSPLPRALLCGTQI